MKCFNKVLLFTVVPVMLYADADDKKPKLKEFAVVGDSLSAGFINFSLHAEGQRASFAALIARQADTPLTLPLISYPGIPPSLKLVAPGVVVRETNIGYRTNPTQQATNLSVPGFLVADMISRPFPGQPFVNPIDALSANILALPGGKTDGCGVLQRNGQMVVSQVECAKGLKPKNILVSAGSNDALIALTFGLPPTSPSVFTQQYRALLQGLSETKADITVTNIPSITSIPFLIPVPVFSGFLCPGVSLPAGTSAADFVVPNIVNPNNQSANVCVNFAVRSNALVMAAATSVVLFNQIIAQEAARVGAAVVDLNTLLNTLAAQGIMVNGKLLTTAFGGGLFSLDGIHPTMTGQAILANAIITTMNQRLKKPLPTVSVSAVAQQDPLFPQ